MIAGIGLDLVELERVEKIWRRHGEKFAKKILHAQELLLMEQENPVNFLAGRFAAKEAVVKALGTGFSNGIRFTDICVDRLESGQPLVRLEGEAVRRLEQLGAKRIFISITHSRHSAAAMAVLET
ncbi:MAG: holo-ACP synthase [Desulfovibrionaceae bacterium]|nr:holo-ACP synthase [Desulfovibrionaceae bacterium]